MAAALERASAATGRLDARICATSVAAPWTRRAAWSGYARALPLQGFELEEIDVFSWGCTLPLPGRPRPTTVEDPFAQFAPWQAEFAGNRRRHWREGLGALASPLPSYQGPQLLRLLEALREIARHEPTIHAWLALPLILQRAGVTRSLLPCLVVGDRHLRSNQAPEEVVVRLLDALTKAARSGLERAEALERDRTRASRVIAASRRPGALLALLARVQLTPLCGPPAIAGELGLTLAGAGRLLARAASHGLLREVSGRQSWRLYLPPDLAVVFGFVAPPRGRPRSEPPPLPSPPPPQRDLSEVFAEFDREMAEVISRVPALAIVQDEDRLQ